jgi:hypothetical protein
MVLRFEQTTFDEPGMQLRRRLEGFLGDLPLERGCGVHVVAAIMALALAAAVAQTAVVDHVDTRD